MDAGGLTREWISVLSTALFDPKNELFTQFNKDDKQALVYFTSYVIPCNFVARHVILWEDTYRADTLFCILALPF